MYLMWTRDSICMADDCNAPNAKKEKVREPLTAQQLLERAVSYVPKYSGAVWVVWAEGLMVGYLRSDDNGIPRVAEAVLKGELLRKPERTAPDFILSSTNLHLHCSYYSEHDFRFRQGPDGVPVEKFPECPDLLEKVKQLLRKVISHGA